MVLMAAYLVQDLSDACQGVRGGSAAWGLLAKGVRDLLWTEAVRHGAGWWQPRNRGGGCDLPMRTRGRARGAAAGLTSLKHGSGLTYGCTGGLFWRAGSDTGAAAAASVRGRAAEVGADGRTPLASESGVVGHREEVRWGERKEAGPD
jgi:hypothetical protein